MSNYIDLTAEDIYMREATPDRAEVRRAIAYLKINKMWNEKVLGELDSLQKCGIGFVEAVKIYNIVSRGQLEHKTLSIDKLRLTEEKGETEQ